MGDDESRIGHIATHDRIHKAHVLVHIDRTNTALAAGVGGAPRPISNMCITFVTGLSGSDFGRPYLSKRLSN